MLYVTVYVKITSYLCYVLYKWVTFHAYPYGLPRNKPCAKRPVRVKIELVKYLNHNVLNCDCALTVWTAPLEYVQIHVYYNPHTDTWTCTRVNVNAPLLKAVCAVDVDVIMSEWVSSLLMAHQQYNISYALQWHTSKLQREFKYYLQ